MKISRTEVMLYLVLGADVILLSFASATFLDAVREKYVPRFESGYLPSAPVSSPGQQQAPAAVPAALSPEPPVAAVPEKPVIPAPAAIPAAAPAAAAPARAARPQPAISVPVPAPAVAADTYAVSGPGWSFTQYGGSCAAAQRPGGFWELTYDVSSPSSLAGYGFEIDREQCAAAKRLSFRVKGENGEEVFALAAGSGSSRKKVGISNFVSAVTGSWQTVTVALDAYTDFRNALRADGELLFLFENSQGMPYQGAVSVADIQFSLDN